MNIIKTMNGYLDMNIITPLRPQYKIISLIWFIFIDLISTYNCKTLKFDFYKDMIGVVWVTDFLIKKKDKININVDQQLKVTDLRFVMYFWEIGFSSPCRYLRRRF